ncbi:MAG: A/G-specific adenine glycosylase [Bacteroidetes bacterium]|nr:MAG: A/G-specific adenine glycosylase [Bacteroidota bacterium]
MFAQKLIHWYEIHKRDLPWRNIKDAYKIWLSEIILQQTRVQQGMPYYLRFVENFPTISDLALASEQEVLRLWQGLGYYSRARNMHHTAKHIHENLNALFPTTYEQILKLKGVGEYTAAAIASFAFEEKVAVLDGNVFRVLSRVFGIWEDILSHQGKKIFAKKAAELLPDSQVSTYNQAVMEFGALHCKPVNPNCEFCPFADHCFAFQNNKQKELPVKTKKSKSKERNFMFFVIESEKKLMLKVRKEGDIWQGLFDFPKAEENDIFQEMKEKIEKEEILFFSNEKKLTLADTNLSFELVNESKNYKHILTHQKIFAKFVHLKVNKNLSEIILQKTDLQLFSEKEIISLPKPKLIVNYLNDYFSKKF